MFCEKCGCIFAEGTLSCPKCGYDTGHGGQGQQQPSVNSQEKQNSMSPLAIFSLTFFGVALLTVFYAGGLVLTLTIPGLIAGIISLAKQKGGIPAIGGIIANAALTLVIIVIMLDIF